MTHSAVPAAACESLDKYDSAGALLEISDSEFRDIRRIIFDETGISLNDSKRPLVCSRLSKRLRKLGLDTWRDYCDYLQSRDGSRDELQQMINCITTNKTEFFREPHHFEFLAQTLFPRWRERARSGAARQIRIWSAACSSGEEPYTIALTLQKHFGGLSGWDVQILASDIDTQVLNRAREGVYRAEQLAQIDPELVRRSFLRGVGSCQGTCRVRPELQRLIEFRQINFVDEAWSLGTKFDAIFCRNVLIYFNRETQQRIVDRLIGQLAPGGHLFLGHSENADWLAARLDSLGGTIYRPRTEDTRRRSDAPDRAAATTASSVRVHSIIAGELFASREPAEIRTTLGSCVSACLYDPDARIGGMNHFVLPDASRDRMGAMALGVHAMEMLINRIMALGGDRQRLRAKLFGGASLFALQNPGWNVGLSNIQFVRQFCATERIPVDAERLGGTQPLLVRFLTETGKTLVKALGKSDCRNVELAEQAGARRIWEQLAPQADTVKLF